MGEILMRMNSPYIFDRDDAFRFASFVHAEARQVGSELQFKYCPYCNGGKNHDKNTFAISLINGAWNCKRGSCSRRGNMLTFIKDFGFSLGEGIDDYYLKRERYAMFESRPIEIKDKAVEYLKGRGIPERITRKYEITIKNDAENVLVFPFKDENEAMWFIKYRNTEFVKGVTDGAKEWCEKDCKPILFGMNHCNFENGTLVLTEGQIDSLSCAAAGIENAVSVPGGMNNFKWYPHCFNFLGRFDELIVFGDLEDGRISLLEDMKTRFCGKIKHVRPEDYKGCKDANEILVKYGPEAVRTCIQNAIPIAVPGLKRMKDVNRIKMSELERMYTNIKALDERCPFTFGELIILTGAAGDGKSTMASQWVTMAINQGYPSMIYSGEMLSGTVKDWIIPQFAGAHNFNDYNDIEEETNNRIEEWENYSGLYVFSESEADTEENNEEFLFQALKLGIQQNGIRFIVIDNLMTAMDCKDSIELNSEQTKFTKRLADIAQKSNVIIVLIVHPRKTNGKTRFDNDDIGGSGNITNRAHKTIRYARPMDEFVDKDGRKWTKEELPDCPIRMLTVMKDRISGHTINKGITLYFEEKTKRISENGRFDWRLGWETDNDGFEEIDKFAEIPF